MHGTPFTGWILLLLTQASLVALRRINWHRRLGVAGIALVLTNLFVLAAIAYDWRGRGSVQPVSLWGGLAILLAGPLRILVGRSAPWHALAAYLTG